MKSTREVNTICGICPAGCWVTAKLTDGRLVKVSARNDHPLGMICRLGEHSPEMVYSSDRLKTPMLRKGPKGTYDFEPVTWDRAYEIITDNLNRTKKKYGPKATAIYTGRGSFDLALCDLFQPKDTAVSSASSVLFPFGSPNTFGVGALCYVSFAMIAPHVTMGSMLKDMESDLEQAELIVVWGSNPATDSPPLTHNQIIEARQNGAKVVVIDPRRTETAKQSGAQWIPIRPGTDGALALSMIQTIIEEDIYDDKFAARWTVGFDDLRTYVEHFRPETAEEITGIPAETIRGLARRLCSARGASPVMYTGLEYSDTGVQSIRATMVLWALAGQLDVPGGRVFRMPQNTFPINKDKLISNPDVKNAIGRDRFPVYSQYRGESHAIALPEAVLEGRPYPIKSLIVLGGSILTAWPEPDIWRQTFENLDFMVTIDRQLTADAAYADIILPATTGYENTSYMVYGPLFSIRERLIEPVGQARNDFLILAELAKRLGYGDKYPQSEEKLLEYVLRNSGFTVDDAREAGGSVRVPTVMMEYKKWEKGLLRPDGKPGFNTPSGKFEIASSILVEHDYDALPVYTEPPEDLTRDSGYPLIFSSGARVKTSFCSQHFGIKGLVSENPEPVVTVNSLDAGKRGIKNGSEVSIMTPNGRARFRARVTDDIIPGMVEANMGGGGPIGPAAWQNCNVNELTDLKRYDPISGFPVYKALRCEIEPVADAIATSVDEIFVHETDANAEARQFDEPAVAEGASKKIKHAIYMDHNATTPLDPEARDAMLPFLGQEYGNPSSIHSQGVRAKEAVSDSRRRLAQVINTTARRVVFTSGGSEADNLAVKGTAYALRDKGLHIITSTIEHPALLSSCRSLEEDGFAVTYVPVDKDGIVENDAFLSAFRPDTILVSIMTANNETGVIQPIQELAAASRERGVVFHTDAVQALGKIPIDIESLGVDLLSISGHKIHGPKGIGALFVREGIMLSPIISGGKQENELRAGTENVAGIVAFAKAAELAADRLPEMRGLTVLRDRLYDGLLKLTQGVRLNGHMSQRLPNTVNVTIPGFRGESIVLRLDRMGIALSSGSACKSGSPDPSHALIALGLSPDEAHCALRFSLGLGNTTDEVDKVLSSLKQVMMKANNTIRFVPCR